MTAGTPRSFQLARYNADTVLACRCIARHGRDLDVLLHPLGDDAAPSSWKLTFEPGLHGVAAQERAPGLPDVVASTCAADPPSVVHAVLEWKGARLRVGVPAQACSLWLAARYPDLPLGLLPDPLLDAAVEAMAMDVAASLELHGEPGALNLVEHGKGDDAFPWPHAWTLAVTRNTPPGRGPRGAFDVSLEMGDAGLARLAQALGGGRPAPGAIDPDGMPVILRALLGATTLPLAEFRACGAGDIILLDRCLANADGSLWLATADGQGIRVRAQDYRFVIVQGWTQIMNDPMSHRIDAAIDGHSDLHSDDPIDVHSDDPGNDPGSDPGNDPDVRHGLDTDAIPIRLAFDLGERTVKLGVLRALQAGEILEQGHALADGYVCIRANGAIVGWGELVDVDGRAGVRILRLSDGPE